MTRTSLFLIGAALFIFSATPVFSEDIPAAPAPDMSAPTTPAANFKGLVDGINSLPPGMPAPPLAAMIDQIANPPAPPCLPLSVDPSKPVGKISAVYTPGPLSFQKTDTGAQTPAQGRIFADGTAYDLKFIELPRTADGLRFIHSAQDGKSLILSVPLASGRGNMAVEKMLAPGGASYLDPSGLLPLNREYAVAEERSGPGCAGPDNIRHYTLTHGVELSAQQRARLSSLF